MPDPERIGDYFAAAMSQVTGCPNQGCPNVEGPESAIPRALGWLLNYRCHDCGTTWTSNWNEESN